MKKLLVVITVLVVFNSVGQDKDIPFDKRLFEDRKEEFDKAVAEIKEGDFYFYDGASSDLSLALDHYLKAQAFNPYSSMLNFKVGVCYLYSNQKFRSLQYLEFAYRVYPEVDPNIRFYLAQAYQLAGEFENAIELYREHKDLIRDGDEAQRNFINKKISECRTGQELKANPVRVWIDNLGDSINTEYPEFSPVISADNRVLFYTARRPDSYGGAKDETNTYYEDIYYSSREYGGEWTGSVNIEQPINTVSHDATVGLAPDGKSLLTYKGLNSKNGDIFITRQDENGVWAEPVSIGATINTKYHESSATLSFDEKTLYFESDQPGGFGQHDIYVAYWDEASQTWGKPENLGPTINTEFEEKGVFFHPDNKTLYFSSNGHNNIGGLDIFKTVLDPETKTWSKPENIGYPINTPDDDIYFVVTGDTRYAYYSSYREDGFGEKDIYKITFLGDKKNPVLAGADIEGSDEELFASVPKSKMVEQFDNSKLFVLKGVVTDGKTKVGISANLSIINAKTNEKVTDIITNSDGTYSVILVPGETYAVTVSGSSYTIASKTLNSTKDDNNKEITMNFELFAPTTGTTFALHNIYFDFDKSDLRHVSCDELDKLAKIMKENPTIVIELAGHTDRRGSDEYNMILSKERAEIAKAYLVSKGIDASRIKTVGYGETKPEISGEAINNMGSNQEKEAAHQQNRRTVVRIISQ
ncbi:MAG: PD40 domain-containing protein [Crocinitomicaceae bacterium]|nr:PD40 domain-containing protein [Crocinitomicaceae bacterium]